MEKSIAAIICAAGSSSRMGGTKNNPVKKEFLPLETLTPGKDTLTVLGAALRAFASCPRIGPIIITLPTDSENAELHLPRELRPGEGSRVFFCSGGPTRRSSVHNALSFLESSGFPVSHVLIHDGARPWITLNLIEQIIDAAIIHGAVIPALPLLETPKEISPGKTVFIKRHLKRVELCGAQTPQGFAFPEILRAHEKAEEKEKKGSAEYTDDAEVWGEFTGRVAVIPGDPENKKITYPEDLKIRK